MMRYGTGLQPVRQLEPVRNNDALSCTSQGLRFPWYLGIFHVLEVRDRGGVLLLEIVDGLYERTEKLGPRKHESRGWMAVCKRIARWNAASFYRALQSSPSFLRDLHICQEAA